MPRFTGQNKKKINPRYFLNETSEREELNERPRDRDDRRGPSVGRDYKQHTAMQACNADKHCEGIEDWVDRLTGTGYYEGEKPLTATKDKARLIKKYSDAISPPDGFGAWDNYYSQPFSMKNVPTNKWRSPGSPLDMLLTVLIRRGVRLAQKADPERGAWADDDPSSKKGDFVKFANRSDEELYLELRQMLGHSPDMEKFGKANNPGWNRPGEDLDRGY